MADQQSGDYHPRGVWRIIQADPRTKHIFCVPCSVGDWDLDAGMSAVLARTMTVLHSRPPLPQHTPRASSGAVDGCGMVRLPWAESMADPPARDRR